MKIPTITKKRIIEYLASGKRFDNRGLLEYRHIKIETGISNQADGSSRVRVGDTEVVAGVKMDVMEPYTDSEDAGVLAVTVELSPIASERFELGPPRIEAIELARLVDRGIRESGFIDFKKLCLKAGEKVWAIFLDIYPINDNGSLIDASCLAAVAALKDARMPKYNEEKERVQFGEWTSKKLPLTKSMPFTMTFYKIGNAIILDPVSEEEESSESRLTISISPYNETGMVNAMQKGKETELTKEELFYILDIADKEWKKTHKHIEEQIEEAINKKS